MQRATVNMYPDEAELDREQPFGESSLAESPFMDTRGKEYEGPATETTAEYPVAWEFETPFLPGESSEAGEMEMAAPEIAAFSEVLAEMKDELFRESLERLADEALEAHADSLAGEYGDREMRDLAAQRVLRDHFAPLAGQAEALLDQFFERLGTYRAESLTDSEIHRVASEVLATAPAISPASEQFMGGLFRKVSQLVSKGKDLVKKAASTVVNLAGTGLAALGKLALPFLGPLAQLARKLLEYVANKAINQLPAYLHPLGQKLADKLFHSIPGEAENAFSTAEAEVIPATLDSARLEAEFDVHAAQLLFTPEESEMNHLVSSYEDSANRSYSLAELDDSRAQLTKALARLQPGESAQPVMEQFLPALWPVAKTAVAILGREKVKSAIAGLIAKLVAPLIGADGSKMLSPAIADVGLRLFGLETNYPAPRAQLAETLAATVEETVNAVAEQPAHVLENPLLLAEAVREAFENAAAAYFPNSAIKPDLRESSETHGMWVRMPARGGAKRYARYSHSIPVEISPRAAKSIHSFGSATLHDHLRDHLGHQDLRPFHGKVTLYRALPGASCRSIACAEGFPASDLHPLTPQASGVLLGPNAVMGHRPTPAPYLHSPQKLHVNQGLYRIEPATGHHHHHHVRGVHSELALNLQRGDIRVWIYFSEPLCQQICADLTKAKDAAGAFRRVKHLIARAIEPLQQVHHNHRIPPHFLVVGYTPNLDGIAPHWLRHAGPMLGARVAAWAQAQVAQYFQNKGEDFRHACESHQDGVTLRIVMTRIPGMEALRTLAHGKVPKELSGTEWPQGTPDFQVVARSGHSVQKLRN